VLNEKLRVAECFSPLRLCMENSTLLIKVSGVRPERKVSWYPARTIDLRHLSISRMDPSGLAKCQRLSVVTQRIIDGTPGLLPVLSLCLTSM